MKQLAIYIHWPFCEKKCPYCDFNSYVMDGIDYKRWLKAYKLALSESFTHTGQRRISSVYFGGGTPSLMPPFMIEQMLEHIVSLYDMAFDIEITLEANPISFEANRFKDFKEAGINRLSIGVQSLRDEALKFLGRWHGVEEAKSVLAFADRYFDRYSFDLIYARPEQELESWKKELKEALTLAKGHISLYQLTVEPATEFGRKNILEAPDDLAAQMYLYTLEAMEKAYMPAYEISNFAKTGQESQHNLGYWRGLDWIGIGPGAHGRYMKNKKRMATQDSRYPLGWLTHVEKYQHGRQSLRHISTEEDIREKIMTGFRMAEGVSPQLLQLSQTGAVDYTNIDFLMKQDFLKRLENGHIAATAQGWLVLNSLLSYLAI